LAYIASRLVFTLIGLALGWPGVIRIADLARPDWLGWSAAALAAHLAAALLLVLLARRTSHYFLRRFQRAT
jgi:hypothetical protein